MEFLKTETFLIKEGCPDIKLTAFCAGVSEELPYNNKRKAMLIIPGGAYWVCSAREAEPIAFAFLARGYNTFVLEYSIKDKALFPAPLIDASLAMKFIKDNAEKFHIDPDFVAAVGFSAGGHLAGSLATLWHKQCVYDAIDMPYGYNKPDAVILSYPVISGFEYAHVGSIDHLLGTRNDELKSTPSEVIDTVSLEKNVDEKTAPAYIWHTVDDNCVPVQNSILFAKELADKKIPFELHLSTGTAHGLSVADETVGVNPASAHGVERWVDDACRWLKYIQKKKNG